MPLAGTAGKPWAEFGYDAVSGQIRTIRDHSTGASKLREFIFDDLGRVIEDAENHETPGSANERRTLLYDGEGFVTHACVTSGERAPCDAATADITFFNVPSPAGEPEQLRVSRKYASGDTATTVVSFTASGTSTGLQQLDEGWPVRDYVFDIYGRGEIGSAEP